MVRHGPFVYATTLRQNTDIRNGPNSSATLIGYVPGAVRVMINLNELDNGWVPVALNWKNKERAWIKRQSVAIEKSYKPYNKLWPLEYVKFISEVGDFIWFFPEGNNCQETHISLEIERISRQTGMSSERIFCQELWGVPESNVLYANPYGQDIDIWYDQDKSEIFINSIASEYVYKYRGGTSKYIDHNCIPGKDIACRMTSDTIPMRSKKYNPN